MEVFDEFADEYVEAIDSATHFSGKGAEFFARRKAETLLVTLGRFVGPTSALSILDIGCGIGITDTHLVSGVGDLHGVDSSAGSISRAKRRNPTVTYRTSLPGQPLPYSDGEFDAAFAICVLHHVAPVEREAFLIEASRTVRRGGVLAVIEHNPYNPLTRRVVRNCAFDRGVELLTRKQTTRIGSRGPLEVVDSRFITFLPFDRKWVIQAESALRPLPLGAQFQVTFRKA